MKSNGVEIEAVSAEVIVASFAPVVPLRHFLRQLLAPSKDEWLATLAAADRIVKGTKLVQADAKRVTILALSALEANEKVAGPLTRVVGHLLEHDEVVARIAKLEFSLDCRPIATLTRLEVLELAWLSALHQFFSPAPDWLTVLGLLLILRFATKRWSDKFR